PEPVGAVERLAQADGDDDRLTAQHPPPDDLPQRVDRHALLVPEPVVTHVEVEGTEPQVVKPDPQLPAPPEQLGRPGTAQHAERRLAPPSRVVAAVSHGVPRSGAMCSWLPSIPAMTIDPSSRRARWSTTIVC